MCLFPNNLIWILLFDLGMLFQCPQSPADLCQVSQILPAGLLGEQAQHHGQFSSSSHPLIAAFPVSPKHLNIPRTTYSYYGRSSASCTGNREHLGFSLSPPKELHIFHRAGEFQQKWRANSILCTKLSEDKALFLECEHRRKEDLYCGGEVSAELFSWFPFLLVDYLVLWLMKNSLFFVDVTNSAAWLLPYYQIQKFRVMDFCISFQSCFSPFLMIKKREIIGQR